VAYRSWATANQYPRFDSDEATMGLAALHIADGSDFPIFFYGQHYMGTVEAYLAAPLVAAFGPTVAALRVPEIVLFGVFLALMYVLTVRIYRAAWFATLVVGVLALGSDRVLKDELIAHGGTAEIKPAAAALFLLALVAPGLTAGRQLLACAGFGVVAGLALWTHWVIVPYVFAAVLMLLLTGRGRITRWSAAATVAGTLVSAAPLIAHNLRAAAGEDSISVFLRLNGGEPTDLPSRIVGGVFLGVPLATGTCDPGDCGPLQRSFALVYLALVAVSAVLAARQFRRAAGERRAAHVATLLLLFAAVASIVAYTRSPAAGRTPVESARYLCCLLVSTPAALWPLWTGLRAGARARIVAASGVAVTVALMAGATLTAAVRGVEDARAAARGQAALLSALAADGVRAVYSEYWTCNRISYLTREETVCATLGPTLRPGLDRWLPYRDRVAADPRPAYAFPQGSDVDRAFAAHLASLGIPPEPTAVGGYHVYRPPQAVPLPR
jgi:hypothetical protein